MSDDLFGRPSPERYRIGYLKLRTLLWDRTTELPAFPSLIDRLRTALDERHHLGLIQLEIAELDLVESIYGWQVFDRVMARVAGTLRRLLDSELPPGSLLALERVAGERFLVFVPQDPRGRDPEPKWLAERGRRLVGLINAVLAGDDLDGIAPRLRARAGHALILPSPFYRFERCIYGALREAEEQAGSQDRRRDLAWRGELERIVGEGAIEMHFQPIVDLHTGEPLGYEALARGPEDSLFSAPRAMFDLSRRLGLAAELDRLCCEKALLASRRLPHGGLTFVNVLLDSLDDGEWRDGRLASLVASLALEPAALVFELSEREAEPDPVAWLERARRVAGAGFTLALDDVGSGRSARAALAELRPAWIKLDGSLVRGLDTNLIKQEVVHDLVEAARASGARVIAEGVQSEAEARCLRAAGVRWGQGLLYAPPAPLEMACGGSARTEEGR